MTIGMDFFRSIDKTNLIQSFLQSFLLAISFYMGMIISGLGMNPFAYLGLVAFYPNLIGLICLSLLSNLSIKFKSAATSSSYICSFIILLYWFGNLIFSNSLLPIHLRWTCGIFIVITILFRLLKSEKNKMIPNRMLSWGGTVVVSLVMLLFSFLPNPSLSML